MQQMGVGLETETIVLGIGLAALAITVVLLIRNRLRKWRGPFWTQAVPLLIAAYALGTWLFMYSGIGSWYLGFSGAYLPVYEGYEAHRREQYHKAVRLFSKAIDGGELNDMQLRNALSGRAESYAALGEVDAALADLDEATDGAEEPFIYQALAVEILIDAEIFLKAQERIVAAATAYPEAAARGLELQHVLKILSRLDEDGHKASGDDLAAALATIGYRGDQPGIFADQVYVRLARRAVERGDLGEALEHLESVIRIANQLPFHFDRRYAPLWPYPPFQERFALDRLVDRTETSYLRMIMSNPGYAGLLKGPIIALDARGRTSEAIKLARTVYDNRSKYYDTGEAGDDYYDASDDWRYSEDLWLANRLVIMLLNSGRTDEARVLMDELLETSIADRPMLVNQAINFAQAVLDEGDFETALKYAGLVEDGYASAYGELWVVSIEACAYEQIGQTSRAHSLVDGMEARREENYRAFLQALFCLNRLDRAAELIMEMLDDSDYRGTILKSLIKYRDPNHSGAFAKILRQRRAEVRARPEVRGKFLEYGRIIEVPFESRIVASY